MSRPVVIIEQLISPHYPPRTRHNVVNSDLTAAFAVDFASPGEKLTRSLAGDYFISIPVSKHVLPTPATLGRRIAYRLPKAGTLNVAGNSLHRFVRLGMSQEFVHQFVYDVIRNAHQQSRIGLIRCGGQLGADIAGAIAGVALYIPVVITMPCGFRQRQLDGTDVVRTRADIQQLVMRGAKLIETETNNVTDNEEVA